MQLGVAQSDLMDLIDRHLVLFHQVAHHGIRHMLRTGQTCLAGEVRVPGHFNNVALLTLQLRGNLIQRLLGASIQDGLAGAEAKLGVRDLRILIKA